MRNNMLVPLKRTSVDIDGPAEKMRARLERHTKYWPVTISNTLMFNLKQVREKKKLQFFYFIEFHSRKMNIFTGCGSIAGFNCQR